VSRHVQDPAIPLIARGLLAEIDALTDEVASLIAAEIDVYRPGGLVPRADLRASVAHNLGYLLGYLGGSATLESEAPRRTGRQRAEQAVPLPEVLRAYRIAIAMLWQRLIDAARKAGFEAQAALLDAASTLWEVSDEYSQALTDAYRQTVQQQLIADERRRSALVASLQNGTTRGQPTAWEIAKLLGMPFEGAFVVVVADAAASGEAASGEAAAGEAVADLEERLRRTDAPSAWRAEPGYDIGVISYGSRRPAGEILAAIRETPGSRIGVSPPYTRLDQTPRATRYALVALEGLRPGTAGVNQLEDAPLSELMIGDLDTTRRFVERVLGPVLRLPDDDRTMYLTTVQAWLDAHGSAADAGRLLYCHENTVRYRMRHLEEHLGGSLGDPTTLAEVAAAMQAIRTFPHLGTRVSDTGP
jgi:PucR C-terminal helix-turn-helix domain/GGDEF-like domain